MPTATAIETRTVYVASTDMDCDGPTTSIWRVERAVSFVDALRRIPCSAPAEDEAFELTQDEVDDFLSWARPYISDRWFDWGGGVSHRTSWGVPESRR